MIGINKLEHKSSYLLQLFAGIIQESMEYN
jgi:hypothetical protein